MSSLLAKDLDDKIEWLEKGDASVAQVEIGLAEAHGQRAEEKGDVEAAVKAYRRALAGYE